MRILRAPILTLLLTLTAAGASREASATPPGMASLGVWEGRLPSDGISGGASHLLEEPAVRALLARLMPAEQRRALRSLAVESPVERHGDHLVALMCRAHACPAEHGMLVLDLARGQLWVGLFSRTRDGTATHWYGSHADEGALPPALLTLFRSRHGG